LYREKGDYKKAESYALRAVEVTEKARGPDHPETATSLNDLAKVYEAMGDTAKAQPLRERAAKIRNKDRTNVAASPQQTVSARPTTSPETTP
jgi:tetratricopeptide (TPR) repeat protein